MRLIKCRKCGASKEKALFPQSNNRRGYSSTCISCYGKRENLLNIDIGDKFNMLTLIDEPMSFGEHRVGLFRCDCGNEKKLRISHVVSSSKKTATTKSCGCLLRDKDKAKKRAKVLIKEEAPYDFVYNHYKRAAKKRGYDFELSKEFVKDIIQKECFYCGDSPSNKTSRFSVNISYNGIDRIDNNTGYADKNCVPCCCTCNRMKMDSTFDSFIEKITKIHSKFKQK